MLSQLRGECGSSIGAVELSFTGGEVPKVFFVCCCKGGLELSECAVGSSEGKPVITRMANTPVDLKRR